MERYFCHRNKPHGGQIEVHSSRRSRRRAKFENLTFSQNQISSRESILTLCYLNSTEDCIFKKRIGGSSKKENARAPLRIFKMRGARLEPGAFA